MGHPVLAPEAFRARLHDRAWIHLDVVDCNRGLQINYSAAAGDTTLFRCRTIFSRWSMGLRSTGCRPSETQWRTDLEPIHDAERAGASGAASYCLRDAASFSRALGL